VVLLDAEGADEATDAAHRLLPTLAPGDAILIVGDDSVGDAATRVAGAGRVRVVRSGPAPLSAALEGTKTAVLVLLSAGARVPAGWLDVLLAPMADPLVAATGSLLVGRGTAQRIAGPPPGTDLADWAARWSDDHAGASDSVNRLDRSCLALRRSAVEALPVASLTGPGWSDELCRRLAVAGHRLVAVASLAVWCPTDHLDADRAARREPDQDPDPRRQAELEVELLLATAQRARQGPLLSASLIVKDEEENLPRCLASLSGLVDEVVVYDTGSTDATVDIARRAGARVIDGYWDDDFARARNASMEHCSGEWVLAIDADEVASGDPATVRMALEVAWTWDAFGVMITNLVGDNDSSRRGLDHWGGRLLRRDRCQWHYRIHEQPTARAGQPDLRAASFTPLRLLHSGYMDEPTVQRNKTARNVAVSEQAVAELVDPSPSDLAANLVNLGRSYIWAGRPAEAIGAFDQALELESTPQYRRAALNHGIEALLALGRTAEAEEWIERLRACSSESSAVLRFFDGQSRLRRGDVEGALECLNGIHTMHTDDGTSTGLEIVATTRARAQMAHGDWSDAVDSLMVAADASGRPQWRDLIVAVSRAGADLDIVVGLVTKESLAEATSAVLSLPPPVGDDFLERLWTAGPDPRILGAAARLAPWLVVSRSLQWSARLRQAGAPHHCPLRAQVGSAALAPAVRLRAAATLETAFGERADHDTIAAIAAGLGPEEVTDVLDELHLLCPALTPAVRDGLSSAPPWAVTA